MQLINCSLKLRILSDVFLEYILIMCIYINWEISSLCIPECLRLWGNQILYKLPCCAKLLRIIVVKCPKRCTSDGDTALVS